MTSEKWTLRMLQIFAEGGGADGGEGGGEGADTGTSAADAGQQRLLELGVPKDKLPKARTPKRMPPMPQQAAEPKSTQPTTPENEKQPAAAAPAEEKPAALDWDAIVKNPDFNNRLQYMMRQRLGEEGSAKEKLAALGPVLQALVKERGVDLDTSDMMKLDADQLRNLVKHDKKFIQQGAAEMGVDEGTFEELTRLRDYQELKRKQERDAQLREAFNKHVSGLRAQAEELKGQFPGFDFDREMQNERFVHMTSPTGGMSVKEAYYALHNDEILQQKTAEAAQKSKEQLAAAVQANQARPRENGVGSQQAAVPKFDYRALSKQDREAFKEEIRRKAYLGEKIYPT